VARLRAKYRDGVADVPAHETEAASSVPLAAASEAPDDASASLTAQLAAHRGAVAANRLETMRERIDIPPPSETAVDDAIQSARQQTPTLERKEPTPDPDPDPADGGDDLDTTLAKTGLPPLAVHWLKANSEYLYDADKNAALQALHHELVAKGIEPYSLEFFGEADRRLNGTGAVPELSADEMIERGNEWSERIRVLQRQLDDATTPEEMDDIGEQIAALTAEQAEALGSAQREIDALERGLPQPDNSAVDRAIADARTSRARPSANVEPAQTSQRSAVSAPPSRESPSWTGGQSTGRRITLTPAMREAARISGISEEQYAKGLLRLREEKERGNYTGKP